MKRLDLNFLCCPRCRHDLVLSPEDPAQASPIESAILTCSACRTQYPVRGGIPRFVSADNYATSFGMQWQRYRRTQLDSHTGKTISRDRLAVATGWPSSLEGE